ncbi:STY4851/ECs_5259 family protein [Lichenibacterium ramalinae]|uniref:STY4851/ECs_5259 family protein n=1 Tax=Lichenibacterium ramalinae TaxID=2316527 RepID=UPI0013EAA278|nr:STY4851/ECs_5259 family protein [Lichenibacterium ramalinae]
MRPSSARNLNVASLPALERILQQAGDDVVLLQDVVDALKRRDDDAGIELWMRAAARLAAARRAGAVDTRDPLGPFLAARKLVRPDGRALHLHRATQSEVDAMRAHLVGARKLGRLEELRDRDAAIFVLFGAEWFRRSFAGGVARWADLTAPIGTLPSQVARQLTDRGLRWWKLPVRNHTGDNEWLLTIRLEGGFPSRLLETQERGWLVGHLRRLIARFSASSVDLADAVSMASEDVTVPPMFRQRDFAALCTGLAVAIVRLRTEHGPDAAAAGVPRLSAWLDACQAGWKEALGIEGEGASRLVDDLVSESLQRLGGDAARCKRLLVRSGDAWRPALLLGVDGEPVLPRSVKKGVSRLYGHPSGALADHLAGQVCVIEPSDDDGPWLCRARRGAPRGPILGFPFAAAASLELRTDADSVAVVTWAAGDPIRGEVLTFVGGEDAGEDPGTLTLVAAGSCRNRRATLYTRAPSGFEAVDPVRGDRLEPIWSGDGFRLFRLTAATHVGPAGGDLFYRVQPGAETDQADHLTIGGADARKVRGVTTPNGDPIFEGPPEVMAHVGGVGTSHVDDVRWRPVGEARWRDLAGRRPGAGIVEVDWVDRSSRATKDRRRVAVLPEGTTLRRHSLRNGGATFTLSGVGGWSIEAAPGSRVQLTEARDVPGGQSWKVAWRGPAERDVSLRFVGPNGAVVDAVAQYPFGTGCFLWPDGTVCNVPMVTLDGLRGLRAVSDGGSVLSIETHGPGLRAFHRQAFHDELPLWSLRDTVSSLLAEAGDLDSEAWVEFEPSGAKLRVARYETPELTPGPHTLRIPTVTRPAGTSLSLRWRSLVDMGDEGARELSTIDDATAAAGSVVPVPDDLPGPGVAYLAEGNVVVSRPVLSGGVHPAPNELSPLRRAVLVANRRMREWAFEEAFRVIDEAVPGSEEDVGWLLRHLALPDALTASTFQSLNTLAHHPATLARLAASAAKSKDAELRDRVWGLERELPFLWVLVGVRDWVSAFATLRAAARSQFLGLVPEQMADELSGEIVRDAAEKVAAYDETLRMTFRLTGLVAAAPAMPRAGRAVAEEHVRRGTGNSGEGVVGSCFGGPQIQAVLRSSYAWIYGFHESHHEALEAPVVAALVAGGRLLGLDGRQRLRIRRSVAEDPQHFAESYAATIRSIA